MLTRTSKIVAAMVVPVAVVGLTSAPVSGQTDADFTLDVAYSCDSNLDVVITYTFTNNFTQPVEIFNPHIGGGGPTLPFSPLDLDPGESSTAVWSTGENPFVDSFTVDMPMMINSQEFQTFYDLDVDEVCVAPPTTTTPSTTTTTTSSTTTTAPATPAPVTQATPTYTG